MRARGDTVFEPRCGDGSDPCVGFSNNQISAAALQLSAKITEAVFEVFCEVFGGDACDECSGVIIVFGGELMRFAKPLQIANA